MAETFADVSGIIRLLFRHLDVQKLNKSVSDAHNITMTAKYLRRLEQLQKGTREFEALTEVYATFAKSVNSIHGWFTGCPCQ